jgi:sulfur carrier protein
LSIQVTINGEALSLESGATIASALGELGVREGGRGVAVALDGEVVPRAQWAAAHIPNGARLEVVVAVQGG